MSSFKTTASASATKRATPAVAPPVEATDNAKAQVIEVLARIAYPEIKEPSPEAGGKHVALFLVEDAASREALEELVGDLSEATFRSRDLPAGAHNPLRDANERKPSGEYAFRHPAFRVNDGIVFRAKTAYQPACVWGPNEVPIDAGEIQGGDEVLVQISGYGYANQSRGVGLSMGRVWLVRKGDVRIERGTGSQAAVRRIDRSRLQFGEGAPASAVTA
jgi:hypothetical protein